MYFTAGQVSKILGLPASTIRYYDKEGLIPSIKRSNGGIRLFTEDNIVSIRLIQCMKQTGLPLAQIRIFMKLHENTPSNIEKRLNILKHQEEVINRKLEEWKNMKGITEYKIWLNQQKLTGNSSSESSNFKESDIPENLLPYYHLLYKDIDIKK